MKISANILLAAVALCLCGCVDCGAFRDLDYADRAELPRLDALALDSDGSAIYGQVLVPSSKFEGPRPCAIICTFPYEWTNADSQKVCPGLAE